MKAVVFNTKSYDRRFFDELNQEFGHELKFLEPHLDPETARLAEGVEAVCVFVNDQLDAGVLRQLAAQGVRLILLRCAGFNNVDLTVARELGLTVARVPAYSPHAVAEHTLALVMGLNRKIHRAFNRVREGNFSLEGLLGFDLYEKTAGVVGTGNIGVNVVRILKGLGCRVLAYDPYPSTTAEAAGAEYVDLQRLLANSDLVTLHCPLTPDSYHLIDDEAVARMKAGVMLINTSRGALVDAPAVIRGLKSGRIGSLGLDVYEEEGDLFFEDLSGTVIQDDVFARLTTFPNVLITGHQAFFTREAMQNIVRTTLENLSNFQSGAGCGDNEVVAR